MNDTVEIMKSGDLCPVCGNFRVNCTCGESYVDDATFTVKNEIAEAGVYTLPDKQSPHGYIYKRPIIGRDTQINGGAYAFNHEAIVIDDEKYPLEEQAWLEIKSLLDEKIANHQNHKEKIFELVCGYVQKKLRYDLKAVDKIDNRIRQTHKGWYKVSLDEFIEAGVGVCRHQALLSAYLLEKMTKETYLSPSDNKPRRYLRGVASVERSINREENVGHAWAKYITNQGESVIIDPANRFVGTFDQLEEERLKRKSHGRTLWYYEGVSRDDPEETEDFFVYGYDR